MQYDTTEAEAILRDTQELGFGLRMIVSHLSPSHGAVLLTINLPRRTPSTKPRNQGVSALGSPAKLTVDPYTFCSVNKDVAAHTEAYPPP